MEQNNHYLLVPVFGDEAITQSKTFERFKRFKEDREYTEDDKRLGRPLTGV